MTELNEFDNAFRNELKAMKIEIIWKNSNDEYEVFSKYKIVPKKPGYEVYQNDDLVGKFQQSKAALSWCIADKFARYTMARDIMNTDRELLNISNDIFVRASVANSAKKAGFKEIIDTKLESKIVRKKMLESQMTKFVNSAKYLQQRGFINETSRHIRST